MPRKQISCVIHTYNSELFLEDCLKTVLWCDEIVIIDMYSDDKTIEIAERYDCKIYYHDNVGFADPARAFGVSKCSHDWILSLDSDELVSEGLKEKLISILNNDSCPITVYRLSRVNFFFGKELIGSGWNYRNDLCMRFFYRNHVNYIGEVHNVQEATDDAVVNDLIDYNASIIHFNYLDVCHFVKKLNMYTDYEIQNRKVNYKGNIWFKSIYFIIREFFGRFIIRKGYKDGWIGFYLSLAMSFYRITAIAKQNTSDKNEIISYYKDMARKVRGDK